MISLTLYALTLNRSPLLARTFSVQLIHILLFLAILSPLLILARAWRPDAQYHGWRIAAVVVLAMTAVAWFLVPVAAGYIGALAWAVLLFLPAIGLRKMTELAAKGDYKSAAKLSAILQILHPTAELREQVRLLRHLDSHQNHRVPVGAVPVSGQARQSQLRSAPAVLVLIVLNIVSFLFAISVGVLNDPTILSLLCALDVYAVMLTEDYAVLFT